MVNTNNKIQWNEFIVGENHPTLADVDNRQISTLHDQFGMHLWKQGTDIVSATTITINQDANYFDVTGTTTITTINANVLGSVIILNFGSALTIQHNSTNLIMPSFTDLAIEAGDTIMLHEFQSGKWRVVAYPQSFPVWGTGVDIGGPGVVTLPSGGHYFTASLDISGINAHKIGTVIVVRMSATGNVFTHNSTAFIMPENRDYITTIDDVMILHEYSSGNWQCISVVSSRQSETQHHNLLINGDFSVLQRTLTGTVEVDDTYTLDRWVFLSEAVSPSGQKVDQVVVSKFETSKAIQITRNSNASDKYGILQIIENRDSDFFDSTTGERLVSLSFKIAKGVATDDVRVALLAWNGTADAVTSDVVNLWGAGGNPSLVTNWAFMNAPTNITQSTTSWQEVRLENIEPSSDANNLAVFIFNNTTTGLVGEKITIKEVQLEKTKQSTRFETIDYATQLSRCKRYFQKVTSIGLNGVVRLVATDASRLTMFDRFETEMRTTPTVTYLPAASFFIGINGATTSIATGTTTLTASIVDSQGSELFITTGATLSTVGDEAYIRSKIDFVTNDAEL